MAAKDAFHNTVKNALQKENWVITHDPLFIRTTSVEVYIDLGAERIITAEKDGEKIAVEIKSFIGKSAITEFYVALGQFITYRSVLEEEEPERILYLAIPSEANNQLFNAPLIQGIIQRYQIKLIVYNPKKEVIEKWTK